MSPDQGRVLLQADRLPQGLATDQLRRSNVPTTRAKAEQFVREMTKAEVETRQRLGIDHNDIEVRIVVKVTDAIRYNNHEDED